MKYNNTLPAEYGSFAEGLGRAPQQSKPHPTDSDYKSGNFIRTFVKKINEPVLFEIDVGTSVTINLSLYKITRINWVISGPKETRRNGKVLDFGVADLNKFEINRVLKEEQIDLNPILPNLLEYWRGN